jgi:hypothetical protein
VATRRKKKPTTKRSNSNIQSAQRAAVQRRLDRDEKRQASQAGKPDVKPPAGKTVIDPRTGLPVSAPNGQSTPGDPVGRGANLAAQGRSDGGGKPDTPTFKGGSEAANKIAGLGSGIMQSRQQEQAARNRKLANPALYGASDKDRAAKLTERMNALNSVRNKQWADQGQAVWMGPKIANARVRNRGRQRMDDSGSDTHLIGPVGDNIVTKDELMSWLADEANFNKIKTAANKAGIAVESYDDVAKVWKSVVDQAAATYSTTGKKVTPWTLLQLRGKTMKNGKPAARTTVSTSIDEMDPAEAKGMIRNAAAQMLGRDPTKEEIEDFISKAQTIAKANPNVTTTTTQYGFDGEAVSQSSYSRGGGDAVTAQAQESAIEQAKQSEDYTAYQAAGVYMPWLMDALASPI